MKANRMWNYFQCQQCGTCCEKIGLPYDEVSFFQIADFLKMPVEKIIENYYGNFSPDGSYWEYVDSKRTPCPFLKHTGGKCFCEIYSVRPEGCRLYPIDTDSGREGIDCPAWAIAYSKLRKEQEEEYY
jgi:Fe-S-cluster containining protein